MDNEIVQKLIQHVRSPLNEATVQHLFTLARKLIERVPNNDERRKYALLKFYRDWTLHSEIDRSETGALILGRIHELVVHHLRKKDNSAFAKDLTAALSLDVLRVQFNDLLSSFGGPVEVLENSKWRELVPILAEIVSHCPLTIGSKVSKLKAILETIRSRPLKGSSVTESLMVIKIPESTFYPEKSADQILYCLMLTTSDTTKIITPLAWR